MPHPSIGLCTLPIDSNCWSVQIRTVYLSKLLEPDRLSTRHTLIGEQTSDGFHKVRGGIDAAIARGLAYAPYADMVWFETSDPSLEEAKA